jgi:hypothetical protein
MNRHSLTYIDLHPEAVGREKAPHPVALIAGFILAAVAVYVSIVFLFSL